MHTRKRLIQQLDKAPLLLPGTLVERYLKCRRAACEICRRQGGHGPAYYLSIRGEDDRTHMIYVSKDRLEEVKKAIVAYKEIRNGAYELAKTELQRWRKRKGRKRS